MSALNQIEIDFLSVSIEDIDRIDKFYDLFIEELTGLSAADREEMSAREWREMMDSIKDDLKALKC